MINIKIINANTVIQKVIVPFFIFVSVFRFQIRFVVPIPSYSNATQFLDTLKKISPTQFAHAPCDVLGTYSKSSMEHHHHLSLDFLDGKDR
jgi:hypothetical protein